MCEDIPTTKKFKVTMEFDAPPYNEKTFEQIGPCFMEEYNEDTIVREIFNNMLFQAKLYSSTKHTELAKYNPEFIMEAMDQQLEEMELINQMGASLTIETL